MQTIIRFGAKKGFQAFPSLASFGSIGNELGSEQGLYLPASIIKSHASFAQEQNAQGVERCLVYSKRSSLQKYHVLALIMPVDAGKPEWRDGAFIGVAMLAQGQMIREKEAIAVLEADLKELLTEHPISSGREESTEPLNWKVSGRSVPISLFSPWRNDLSPRSAQLIPAKAHDGSWLRRIESVLDSVTNLERLVILPYHEAAPNISGWNASPAPEPHNIQSSTLGANNIERSNTPIAAPNDDIKRLSEALEHEQKLNEKLTEENKRLLQSIRKSTKQRFRYFIAIGLVAMSVGGIVVWSVMKRIKPKDSKGAESRVELTTGPYNHYWESLAYRSSKPKVAERFPRVEQDEDFLEFALGRPMSVKRAALDTIVVGSKFFDWRLEDLDRVFSKHAISHQEWPSETICTPCLKYGILKFETSEGKSAGPPMSFVEMKDEIAPLLDSAGNSLMEELYQQYEVGFLAESRCVAVQEKHPLSEDIAPKLSWYEKANDYWESGKKEFAHLSGTARMLMIGDLTDYIAPGINDGKQKGDTLVFWVPKIQ